MLETMTVGQSDVLIDDFENYHNSVREVNQANGRTNMDEQFQVSINNNNGYYLNFKSILKSC